MSTWRRAMPASFSMIRLPRRISRQVDDFVVDRELPTSGRVELEDSQRPDLRAAWCPPGSTRSGSLPLFRDPQRLHPTGTLCHGAEFPMMEFLLMRLEQTRSRPEHDIHLRCSWKTL